MLAGSLVDLGADLFGLDPQRSGLHFPGDIRFIHVVLCAFATQLVALAHELLVDAFQLYEPVGERLDPLRELVQVDVLVPKRAEQEAILLLGGLVNVGELLG